tara:strand:- start:169 stop:396 length:228 start_codon:yes stop_codon:yes gene_type:complete
MHGKRLRRSPVKKQYDFSNYKPYTGKGTIGEKLSKSYANKFKNIKSALSEILPFGKAKKTIKLVKGVYDSTKKKT